jgi:hypothetical protein
MQAQNPSRAGPYMDPESPEAGPHPFHRANDSVDVPAHEDVDGAIILKKIGH